MEWAYIPAVEYIHHLRTALWPLNPLVKFRWQHRVTAAVGTAAVAYFFAWLFRAAGGGVAGLGAVALYVTAVNIQLHTLMIHDCFQHTVSLSRGCSLLSPRSAATSPNEETTSRSDTLISVPSHTAPAVHDST